MSKLENYLNELRDTRATGEAVKETSFYPALSNLLNNVGAELNPKVRAVINLKNRGAGLPDGGLFTARQLKKLGGDGIVSDPAAFKGQQPERGVIEVKGTGEEVRDIAEGEQVTRYLKHYGQVLVTNLREFLLVGREASGAMKFLEGYALADSEKEFWQLIRNPRELAKQHEARVSEYLKRVMLASAPLDAPEALAWFLASYARDARERMEREPSAMQSLKSVREALEQALGLKFEGEQGEQFFRSTLVQTLFYGVFSAWVLWSKSDGGKRRRDKFNWRLAAYTLRVPAISTLFEQVVTPSNVRGLGLEEVLDWTAETLNRVEPEKFFERFEREHAVQYFYEPFLEAFDPELRKQLGVWYTPDEIVRYMVERTDRALREELKIENGLADERVYVLDPCCGTGAYLVEVLKRIKRTIEEQGGDALNADDLKKAAIARVFGFEILPAPYVVAHMQLGFLLQSEGLPLAGNERVGVFLTNALTGWEPPKEPKKQLPFAFHTLEEERDAAEHVKRDEKILVVIGNPPYNAFAGTSTEEEGDLVDVYKQGLIKEWGIKKFNLDDLYVRFFRLAERRIAEKTGRGIVCFISNFSYLSDPSFVMMRQRFLSEFDKLWFDSLNGDSRETGKQTPEGKPDPSIFSTPFNREGIRVGTAIGLLARKEVRDEQPEVRTRELWGATKRQDLLDSLDAENFDAQYMVAQPGVANRYSLRLSEVGADYLAWAKLDELCKVEPLVGFLESRRGGLIDTDKDELEKRIQMFYDPAVKWSEIKALKTGITEDASDYKAQEVRAKLQSKESFQPKNIRRYVIHPFDTRWCYYSSVSPLWNRSRPEFWEQCWSDNGFIVTRMKTEKTAKGSPVYFSTTLVDYQTIARNVSVIPLRLRTSSLKRGQKSDKQSSLLDYDDKTVDSITANLSARARAYLDILGISDVDDNKETAALVWYHALAIGYAPAYLDENGDGIRSDFPRVPLPATREALEESAALGRQIAQLLDTETHVPGVTSGALRPELRSIANIRRMDGAAALNPQAGDLELHAGWGHKGRAGVVMPGKGRSRTRDYTSEERAGGQNALTALGGETLDIFLNETACWSNVPARVWDYTIGGYQVIKKWLSYREGEILGRSLTSEEAREVTQTARRIAAILMLETELDANYERVKAACHAWE
ncbi:MAG: N-6 DNA methylase [Acidobacteria bacterium]|nr:N-6 DNA methylase [Acidobacteriota bacterium]